MWLRKRRFWLFDIFCPSEPLRANWYKPENLQMLGKNKAQFKTNSSPLLFKRRNKTNRIFIYFWSANRFFSKQIFIISFSARLRFPIPNNLIIFWGQRHMKLIALKLKIKRIFCVCLLACEWNLSIESILMRKCGDIAHFNVVFQSSDFQFYLYFAWFSISTLKLALSVYVWFPLEKKWDFSTWFRIIDYDFWNMKFIEAFHGSVADSMWKVKIGWDINKMEK